MQTLKMELLTNVMTRESSLLAGSDNSWHVVSSQLLMIPLVVNQDVVKVEGEALDYMGTVCLRFWGDNNYME